MTISLWGNIQKVEEQDDGTIRVYGIASAETVDAAGEIVRAEAIRDSLDSYRKFPALREMHGLSAAGTTLEIDVGDDNITRIIGHVVDPVAITKCKTNVYRGFSIGGKVKARDPKNPKIITALELREVSLVDRPACPDAVMTMWKADMPEIENTSDIEEASDQSDDVVDAEDKAAATAADLDEGNGASADSSDAEQHEAGEEDSKDAAASAEEPDEDGVDGETLYKRKFDAKERKADAKSGSAMKDGSFPIEDKGDLRNAIRLAGKAKNPAAARAHIKRRAKALGLESMIPDTWKDTKKVAGANPEEDEAAKAGTVAAPLSPTKIPDVIADGGGNGDSTAEGAAVAGKHIVHPAIPPDAGATAEKRPNAATADNAGQDKLDPASTPVVEASSAETPKDGTDLRTHKHPDGDKAAEADPITKAREAAVAARKGAVAAIEKAHRASGVALLPEPLRKGAELRKGLGTVSRLGYLLSELAYILSDVRYEAEMEGDDSPVPAQLRDALKPLAEVYRAMSDEELTELMAMVEAKAAAAVTVAISGGDVQKAAAAVLGDHEMTKAISADEDLSKALSRITDLECQNDELLKLSAEQTDDMQALAKRVDELAAMPMPPKTAGPAVSVEAVVAKTVAVSKEEDTVGIAKAAVAAAAADGSVASPFAGMSQEDLKKAWESLDPDLRADFTVREALRHPIPIKR